MHSTSFIALALAANGAVAFPWVARQPGVDTSLLHSEAKRQQAPTGAGSLANCPVNLIHLGAAPIRAPYLYNNAMNGAPGKGVGGYRVPAVGDTAHAFVAPDYTKDIRGPCPGLNAAANHNFLSHDGITTFNELVDAQQNVYNVGYDLSVLLAVLGLTLADGDIVTQRLSIGCDATPRTSVNPVLTGSEPGLDGHNKFEADSSLTRNDYFTHNGDNFRYNATLFQKMTQTTGGYYDLPGLSKYRYQRYWESRIENPNFYFGPFALLLYGAASFLYELMPSGPDYTPNSEIYSFFGAKKDGSYAFTGKERIPDNWTNRVAPYTNNDVGNQIITMYALNPVEFGVGTGNGTFNVISTSDGTIQDGKLNTADPKAVMCAIYQAATERIPSFFNGVVTPTVESIAFAISKLQPGYENLGCPIPLSR